MPPKTNLNLDPDVMLAAIKQFTEKGLDFKQFARDLYPDVVNDADPPRGKVESGRQRWQRLVAAVEASKNPGQGTDDQDDEKPKPTPKKSATGAKRGRKPKNEDNEGSPKKKVAVKKEDKDSAFEEEDEEDAY